MHELWNNTKACDVFYYSWLSIHPCLHYTSLFSANSEQTSSWKAHTFTLANHTEASLLKFSAEVHRTHWLNFQRMQVRSSRWEPSRDMEVHVLKLVTNHREKYVEQGKQCHLFYVERKGFSLRRTKMSSPTMSLWLRAWQPHHALCSQLQYFIICSIVEVKIHASKSST